MRKFFPMNQALQKGAIIFGVVFVLVMAAVILSSIGQAIQEDPQEPNETALQQSMDTFAQEETSPSPLPFPVQDPLLLLPSIEILPAKNIIVEETEEAVYLRFGATYANKGQGPLELVNILEEEASTDQEPAVFQRIYKRDGTTQDHEVGIFFWHGAHGHFHFTDFMEYELRPAGNPENPVFKEKITYCLRDTDLEYPDLPEAPQEKVYPECGLEQQGISVGWSDTYDYNFPDQNINITGIETGLYELIITFDLLERLQEIDRSDNTHTTLLHIDRETNSVEVREQ